MATSTFERKIEIKDPASVQKLVEVMTKDAPKTPFSDHPYTAQERERSLRLFRQCLSRSKV